LSEPAESPESCRRTSKEQEEEAQFRNLKFPTPSKFPLLAVTRFVDATLDMFCADLCRAYDLDVQRFRAYLVKKVTSNSVTSIFDAEEWIAKYCHQESLRLLRKSQNRQCFFVKSPDSPDLFQGWLLKRGWINRSWKRRFIRLENTVMIYATDSTSPPRGSLRLSSKCSVAEAVDDEGARCYDIGFILKTESRAYYFRVFDPWQQKAWVAAFRCAINRRNSDDEDNDFPSAAGTNQTSAWVVSSA